MESAPELIYLDWNVLVSLLDPSTRSTAEHRLWRLLMHFKTAGVVVPFTHAHVAEALAFQDEEGRRARLQLLVELSDGAYLDPAERAAVLTRRDPFELAATLTDVPEGAEAIHTMSNWIPDAAVHEMRVELGLSAIVLNNIDPVDAIPELNRLLANYHHDRLAVDDEYRDRYTSGRFPIDIIGLVRRYVPAGASELASFVGLISVLDVLNYHADPRKERAPKGTGRFWDAYHAYLASCCDLFITNDTRLQHRTRAAYAHYGYSTEVLNCLAAVEILERGLGRVE